MFEDSIWNDSDVQGFQFDWDQSEQRATFTKPECNLPPTFSSPLLESPTTTFERPACVSCHSVLNKEVIYENKFTFCSQRCWETVLRSVVDDLAVGAIGTWTLDAFCSYAAKAFLLNLACTTFDGNLIIKLLRGFQLTLSRKLFERLLVENNVAFHQFCNFLKKTGDFDQLHNLQMIRGLVEHAKIQRYTDLMKQLDSLDTGGAIQLAHRLRTFATTELAGDQKLSLLNETTWQLADLLYFQSQHEEEWRKFRRSEQPASSELSTQSSGSLVALPLGETIRACAQLDKGLGPGTRVHQLRNQYKVCDDQFRWLLIEPLVMNANWMELDGLLLEKKWLKRQMRTTLPYDRLATYLHSLNAPTQILENYLSYTEDPDEMIELATRLRMFSIALKCCAKRKDSTAMKELLSRIPKRQPEHAEVLRYLSIPISQWKEVTTK